MAVFYLTKSVNRLFIVTNSITLKSIRNRHVGEIMDVKFERVHKSKYLQPFRMTYKENGKNKKRDILDIRQYVLTLTFNIDRKVFILEKHFRPALYYTCVPAEMRDTPIDLEKYPQDIGMVSELCGGIVRKQKSIIQVAQFEVSEEFGYDVPIENFQIVHDYTINAGISGTIASVCYCEVTDQMKRSGFDKLADVVEMNIEEFEKYITTPVPSCVLIGYYWFKNNKYQEMITNK